jgi:hypothetical protein
MSEHEEQSAQKGKNKSSHKITAAPVPQGPVDQNNGQETTRKAQKYTKIFEYLWKHSLKLYNRVREIFRKEPSAAWTAIFTAFLVVFTGELVSVTNKVDETTRQTQRAFITQSNVVGGGKIIKAGKWTDVILLVNWENSGNTPIRHGVVHADPHTLASDPPEGFDFFDSSNISRKIDIGPRTTAQTTVVVPVSYFDQAREGKALIFIWGWLSYRDIFFPQSPQHVHGFCVKLMNVTASKPDLTDPTSDVSWVTASCEEHNCDDDDCTDYKTHLK